MKTYHIDRDGDLIDSETGMLADNSHDEVVPASVAQALYDALQKVAQRLDANDCDEWTLYALKTTAFETLALADGEE